MDSKSTGKLRWVALGFAPVLWCVWTTASAAMPLPMVVVNGAATKNPDQVKSSGAQVDLSA